MTKKLSLTITSLLLSTLFSTAVLAQTEAELEPVSGLTWIIGLALCVALVVGVVLSKVKANKNKEEIRRLMEKIKED